MKTKPSASPASSPKSPELYYRPLLAHRRHKIGNFRSYPQILNNHGIGERGARSVCIIMHIFIDDSGDPGFKIGAGSTSHLVIAACIFSDPKEIEKLAEAVKECRARYKIAKEFKFNKTKDRVRHHFYDCIEDIDYSVRAIVIDKSVIYSKDLRENPRQFRSFAIRKLLMQHSGQIKDAKIIIDGQDTWAFGLRDSSYLRDTVNHRIPGSINQVKFHDSRKNIGIQLADMTAGAINRAVCSHKESDSQFLQRFAHRLEEPEVLLWHFE